MRIWRITKMDIIKNTGNYTGKELYKLTKSNSVKRMSDISEDEVVTLLGYVTYKDEESGNIITAIDTESGAFATNSKTFYDTLDEIATIMGDEYPIDIKVGHGKSHNGRDFIYCDLV